MTDKTLTPGETAQRSAQVLAEVQRAVVGHRRALELVLIGILAGGHILLEDLPGLGKTLIARTFAQVLGLDFARIQFTPDMLPSDVIGAPMYDQRTAEMQFRPGPVFTQLLLADEINRTPPKTQAALLEAMGEGQVSMDGQTRPLPQPFVVLATDNPIEYEGTYELPEAQLDRFLMRLRLGYLDSADEAAMLQRRLERRAENAVLQQVTDAREVLAMRAALEDVEVSADLIDYVVALVRATREHRQIQVGASPRGGLAIIQLARGRGPAAAAGLRDPGRHQERGRARTRAPDHPAARTVGPPGPAGRCGGRAARQRADATYRPVRRPCLTARPDLTPAPGLTADRGLTMRPGQPGGLRQTPRPGRGPPPRWPARNTSPPRPRRCSGTCPGTRAAC